MMKKDEMMTLVANIADTTKVNAVSVIDAFVNVIRNELLAGHEVRIHDIGILKPSVRAERVGRNMKTGGTMPIPEQRVVKLALSADMKRSLASLSTYPWPVGQHDD